MDENLLEDFRSEMEQEDKSRKSRSVKIFAGLSVGLIVVILLAILYSSGEKDKAVELKDDPTVASSGANDEEPLVKSVDSSAPVTDKTDESDDERLSMLQEENRIDEDFKAPGALMNDTHVPVEGVTKDVTAPEPIVVDGNNNEKVPAVAGVIVEKKTVSNNVIVPDKVIVEKPEAPVEEAVEKPMVAKPVVKQPAPVVATVATPVSPPKAKYSIQIAAFGDAGKALRLRDSLLKKGYDAWIRQSKVRQNIFAVNVGRYNNIKASSQDSANMKFQNIDNKVTYLKSGGKVTLQIGLFKLKSEAVSKASLVSGKGFRARIENVGKSVDTFMVRVGKFKKASNAKKEFMNLRTAGLKPLGVVGIK